MLGARDRLVATGVGHLDTQGAADHVQREPEASTRLQVMPTARADHPGTGGPIEVLKFGDGTALGRTDGQFGGRTVSEPRQLRVLELRYGITRAQALTPGESLVFIEQVLGET